MDRTIDELYSIYRDLLKIEYDVALTAPDNLHARLIVNDVKCLVMTRIKVLREEVKNEEEES